MEKFEGYVLRHPGVGQLGLRVGAWEHQIVKLPAGKARLFDGWGKRCSSFYIAAPTAKWRLKQEMWNQALPP